MENLIGIQLFFFIFFLVLFHTTKKGNAPYSAYHNLTRIFQRMEYARQSPRFYFHWMQFWNENVHSVRYWISFGCCHRCGHRYRRRTRLYCSIKSSVIFTVHYFSRFGYCAVWSTEEICFVHVFRAWIQYTHRHFLYVVAAVTWTLMWPATTSDNGSHRLCRIISRNWINSAFAHVFSLHIHIFHLNEEDMFVCFQPKSIGCSLL